MHGLSEVAGQGIYSVLGLRKLGEDAEMVVWMPNMFGYSYDRALNIDKKNKKKFIIYAVKIFVSFLSALFRYDIYHFHYGRSFLLNKELKLMKLLHKKVFYEFHGSDLRNNKIANNRNHYFVFPDREKQQKKLSRRNKIICKNAEGVIIHDYELEAYLPEVRKNVYYVPLRIDINAFIPRYPSIKAEKIVIVHAPSNPELKGTSYILRAIENLKKKYPIEFVLVQNKTQDEAKIIYQNADIIVDQLIIGTYGVFALEGMALGKPVITYIMDDMINNFPEELPIQNANIDNIQEVLENLIKSPKLRHKIGIAGRKYVEDYHDYRKVAAYLRKIYLGEQPPVSARTAFYNVKRIK